MGELQEDEVARLASDTSLAAVRFASERLAADRHVLEVSDRLHALAHGAVQSARTGERPAPPTPEQVAAVVRSRSMLDVSYAGSRLVGEYLAPEGEPARDLVPGDRYPDRIELTTSHRLLLWPRAVVTGPRPVTAGIRRCNQILERAGDDFALAAVTETMLAVLEAMEGRFDEARVRWQQGNQRLEDVGLSVTVAVLQMYHGFIELMAGTPEDAQLQRRSGSELASSGAAGGPRERLRSARRGAAAPRYW